MSDRPRILIAEPDGFSVSAKAMLEAAGEVHARRVSESELASVLRDYDVVWLRLGYRIDAQMLADARCHTIACAVTGLDHIDLDACKRNGVEVMSLKGEAEFLREVRATAEHTVSLALALPRRLVPAATAAAQGEWRRDDHRGFELYRKTVGIVGVGRLGTIVAGYFKALGMEVLGSDRLTFNPTVAVPVDLDGLLSRSDVVSLHVSLDDGSRHLIGERELRLMKPTAYLINTARGAVVDGDALLEALRAGRIAGAALDVLEGEPDIDAGHPLVKYAAEHENLILTPHIGGNTFESFEKTECFVADKVVARLGGMVE